MDELKLVKWKTSFERTLKPLQIEYDSVLGSRPLEELFTIELDLSNDWDLKVSPDLPSEIRERLEKLFWDTKPEDSI